MKERQKHWVYQHTIGLLPRSWLLYKLSHIYLRHYFGFNYGVTSGTGELWLAQWALKGKQEPVVFDVGANVGDWSLAILGFCPTAHVHAFEPALEAYKTLASRVAGPNVTLNRLGVGASPDVLPFYEYGVSALSSFHNYGDREPRNVYVVEVCTLADYCRVHQVGYIDLLKVDTEGHDFWVLKGAEPLLREQRVPVIQFEYGPANINSRVFLRDIFDYIVQFPYAVFRLYPRYLLPVPKYGADLENLISVNYVLIANDSTQRFSSLFRK